MKALMIDVVQEGLEHGIEQGPAETLTVVREEGIMTGQRQDVEESQEPPEGEGAEAARHKQVRLIAAPPKIASGLTHGRGF